MARQLLSVASALRPAGRRALRRRRRLRLRRQAPTSGRDVWRTSGAPWLWILRCWPQLARWTMTPTPAPTPTQQRQRQRRRQAHTSGNTSPELAEASGSGPRQARQPGQPTPLLLLLLLEAPAKRQDLQWQEVMKAARGPDTGGAGEPLPPLELRLRRRLTPAMPGPSSCPSSETRTRRRRDAGGGRF